MPSRPPAPDDPSPRVPLDALGPPDAAWDGALVFDAHRRRHRLLAGEPPRPRKFRVPFPSPLRSPEPVKGMWGEPFLRLVEWPAAVDPLGIPLFRIPGVSRYTGILDVAEHILFPGIRPDTLTREQRLAATALARCALCIRKARVTSRAATREGCAGPGRASDGEDG